jgi:hypothetical protein
MVPALDEILARHVKKTLQLTEKTKDTYLIPMNNDGLARKMR